MQDVLSNAAKQTIEEQMPGGAKYLLFVITEERSSIYTNIADRHVLPYLNQAVAALNEADAAVKASIKRN